MICILCMLVCHHGFILLRTILKWNHLSIQCLVRNPQLVALWLRSALREGDSGPEPVPVPCLGPELSSVVWRMRAGHGWWLVTVHVWCVSGAMVWLVWAALRLGWCQGRAWPGTGENNNNNDDDNNINPGPQPLESDNPRPVVNPSSQFYLGLNWCFELNSNESVYTLYTSSFLGMDPCKV